MAANNALSDTPTKARAWLQRTYIWVRFKLGHTKEREELGYWKRAYKREDTELENYWYEQFYTAQLGLTHDSYKGKRVLDIGCGPRGSLEWATEAAERVGLDPLVEDYRELGIDQHEMDYVASGAESMPFEDGHFDIVALFNSLDHVDDAPKAIAEVTRVTRPGGTALVIVEVNHDPTPAEPHRFEWDLFDSFEGWSVVEQQRCAIRKDHNVYLSVEEGKPWRKGAGILVGRLERNKI
ncbi:MAG: class I SAM-dependent methyltransferase [Solirubrobacterales bacterium]